MFHLVFKTVYRNWFVKTSSMLTTFLKKEINDISVCSSHFTQFLLTKIGKVNSGNYLDVCNLFILKYKSVKYYNTNSTNLSHCSTGRLQFAKGHYEVNLCTLQLKIMWGTS